VKIVVHQSLCGEKNKAWELLKTTMPDFGIAKSLAFKADLQEQTGDTYWVPAIRGFVEGDYFLIIKTFEDTSTEVRRGRKFSHVLIIHKDEIIKIDNLQPILSLLHGQIDKEASIELISIDVQPIEIIIEHKPSFQGRFNKLVHGYLNIKEYSNTIIWFGQEDFDLSVVELWKRLNIDERKNFRFGISFHNDSIGSENINLMAVPESIQSKFIKSGFFLIGKNDKHTPTELAEQILIGDKVARQRINNFQETIDSETLLRNDITFVAKGISTFEKLDTVSDIKKINTLSHIIAKYASSELQGEQYKSRILARIVDLIESNTFSEITVLRTFKCDSFKDSKQILSNALAEWINNNIFQSKEKTNDYISFFDRFSIVNPNWWDDAIEKELKSFLGEISTSKASIIYKWLLDDSSILVKINTFLDKSNESESSFLEKLPKNISDQLIEQINIFSIQNKWFRLYAQLLNKQFDFNNALTELLKVDQDENSFDAINILLKGKEPKLIIDFAVKGGETRILKKSGELLQGFPKLLNAINVLNVNWQTIWLEAIHNGIAIETGLKEPIKIINELFDGIIAENPTSEELLLKISESEYGNIISYPNRNLLWKKLPSSARVNFLKKTSSILLEGLSENSTTKIPDDYILTEYISQTGISDFLYFNRNNIKSIIPIFEKFSQLSDYNLADYLNNYSGQINAVEATQLGKVINNRNFHNSASIIHNKADKYNNWKFALSECHFILGFFQKAAISISGILSSVNIPTDQWWQSAEDIIVELYPNATSIVTIWKKAGGKESELIMSNTAANAWNDALHKLRRNRFKEIRMNDLLKEMKKQYDQNTKFKIIYDLRKNYIKTK
jgi:hypothetical protein